MQRRRKKRREVDFDDDGDIFYSLQRFVCWCCRWNRSSMHFDDSRQSVSPGHRDRVGVEILVGFELTSGWFSNSVVGNREYKKNTALVTVENPMGSKVTDSKIG
jgi:hypothetical protein